MRGGSEIASFPVLPSFCSAVCVWYNTQKEKSGEKQGRPGNTVLGSLHVTWTCGGCRGSSAQLHMWQSRVEIEHYSVAYFDRIAAFEAL